MYCEKCGKLLPDNAKFCDGCGTKTIIPEKKAVFIESAGNSNGFTPETSKQQKNRFLKNKFNAFAVALTVVLAVILVAIIVAKPKRANQKTSAPNINIGASISANKPVGESKHFLSAQSWQEMSFMLDGVEFNLPVDISELEKYGWNLDYSDEKVEPGKCINFSANNELSYIKGTLCNFGDSKTDSKNCKVRSVCFNWASGVFPKDIIILSSGIADVYDAYGDADYFDEYNKSYIWGDKMGYLGGKGAYIRFFFDSDDIISFADIGCEIG